MPLFALLICQNTNAQIITTIAGGGSISTGSDGLPATSAQLNLVCGCYTDAIGNLYVTSNNHNNVRMVNTAGIISTFAGSASHVPGNSGDGGQATAALLTLPYGVTGDAAGNIYISCTGNPISYTATKVKKVSLGNVMSAVAGGGTTLGEGIPATAAQMKGPRGMAIDVSGNVYVAECSNNNRIRKITTSGIATTVVGGSSMIGYAGDGGPASAAKVNAPSGVAIDGGGNMYFADLQNHCIRKINSSGIISTFAGTTSSGFSGDGGAATLAQMGEPWGVATDAAGNVYIADYDNNRIRKVNTSGIITTVAGNGTATTSGDGGMATAAGILAPTSVHVNNIGNLFITSNGCNCVRLVTMPTYPPSFTGGSPQSLTVCESSGATSINTLLAVDDASPGRTLTWSMVSGPSHGSAVVSYTTLSTGDTVTPMGLTYIPTAGYSGPDAFTVQVTDGTTTVTTTINVTVTPAPSAGTITGPSGVCVSAAINLTDAATGGTWSAATASATVSSVGLVTGVSAGNNVISYSVTNTCGTAVSTHSITISSPPSAGTISGPSTVCVSSSILLSNSVGGGTWSSSGVFATVSSSGVVSGVAAGTEIITYTVSNACGSASVTTSISVNTGPSAGVISGLSQVCEGASISLSETVTGGTWSSSNTNATVSGTGVVSGGTAGTSVISYTISSSCGSTSATHTVTINPLPVAGAISGSSTVCVGGTVNLTDPVAGGIWTSSNANATVTAAGAVTGMAAGAVTISYTVTNSCGSAFATHGMTVNVPPTAGSISGPGTVCVGSSITLSNTVSGGAWTSSGVFATVGSTGVVTGISTGAETITYTVTNACGSATATAVVNVAVGPSPGVISGPTSVCEGATISLSSTATGGTWSADNANVTISGGGVVTGVNAGTVTISYTLSSACGITAAVHNLTVIALPVAGTVTGSNTVCVGTTTALANAATGGVWSTVNGNASVTAAGIVTGVTTGVDTVVYTVTNSCGTATAKFPITVLSASDCVTGSELVATPAETLLEIYPNPTNATVSINVLDNVYTEAKVTITNVVGKIIREQVLSTNSISKMEIQAEPGIYFVSASVGTKTLYKRLVIIR